MEEKNLAFPSYPKTNQILFIGIFLVSAFAYIVSAQSEDYNQIPLTQGFQDDIKNQSASVEDLSVGFIQLKYIQYLETSIESKGRLYFKKPGKILWQYTEPYEFVLIINNGEFHLFDPQKKMNFKEKENVFFNEIGSLVQESLNGNLTANENYDLILFSNSLSYKLSMRPTDESIKQIIEKVEIIFEKESFQLSSFSFTEPSGDVTSICLQNISINTSLPDSKFSVQ